MWRAGHVGRRLRQHLTRRTPALSSIARALSTGPAAELQPPPEPERHRGDKRARQLTTSITSSPDAESLLSLFARRGDDFNDRHISAFWTTLGRLARAGQTRLRLHADADAVDALREPCHATAALLSTQLVEPRVVSSVLHSLAAARLTGHGPWEHVWRDGASAALASNLREYAPQALSNLAWALAHNRGSAPSDLLDAIAIEITACHDPACPRPLTERCPPPEQWPLSSPPDPPLGLPAHPAARACPQARLSSPHSARSFTPQGLANTAWAFAEVSRPASAGGAAIGAAAGRAAAAASPLLPARLFDAIAAVAASRAADFNEQELSNLARAFATAGHEAPELLDAIARAAQQRSSEFTPQGAVTASSA